MSNDLVKRLYERFAPATRDLCVEAADRIEELEARIEELSGAQHKAGSSGTIPAQSPSEQHQTPIAVFSNWVDLSKL